VAARAAKPFAGTKETQNCDKAKSCEAEAVSCTAGLEKNDQYL